MIMKQKISIILLFLISLNYLNVVEIVLCLTHTDQKEFALNDLLEEGSEKSKDDNKGKEKGEDLEKFLHNGLKFNFSGSIDLNDYICQATTLESLSYKEALIQPPDLI